MCVQCDGDKFLYVAGSDAWVPCSECNPTVFAQWEAGHLSCGGPKSCGECAAVAQARHPIKRRQSRKYVVNEPNMVDPTDPGPDWSQTRKDLL